MGFWGDLVKAVRSSVFKNELKNGGFQVNSAEKLATSRTLRTNLASTSAASFDGTKNVTLGITGTLPVPNGGTGATTAGATALSNIGLKSKRVIIKVNKSPSSATESQGAVGYYNLGVKASFCVATISGCGNSEANAQSSEFNTLPTADFARALPVVYSCAESSTSNKTLVCIKHGRPVTSDIYYQVDVLYI